MKAFKYIARAMAFWCSLLPIVVWAGIEASLEDPVRLLEQGRTPERLIAGAELRVGVFTYQDPDRTGLGNPLAELVAHEILMNTPVQSLGVLIFEDDLAPSRSSSGRDRLSYFDKVERVTEAQGVTLAVWGMVRAAKGQLVVDTFIQVPEQSLEKYLAWRFPLPEGMGGQSLQAYLRPDRIPVQRLRLPSEARKELLQAARRLIELRKDPESQAEIIGTRPRGQVYYVMKREGDWVFLRLSDSLQGWVPVRGHCAGNCSRLLESAAFTGRLVRYMADKMEAPYAGELTVETRAIGDQITALDALNKGSADVSLEIARRWLSAERRTGSDLKIGAASGSGIPPGGAAFANIQALANVKSALKSAGGETGKSELSTERARTIAFELAQASQYDPRNQDVLHNLSVLFAYAGDQGRARLAKSLIESTDR
jgi:hypothetical protein